MSDREVKRRAPATERNRMPIADILERELPATGMVLEIASGTGEHAVFFASRFPHLSWQPSDGDGPSLESIRAWSRESEGGNVLAPLVLDAASREWPVEAADAVFCANMIHISPWTATEGVFAGAGRVLKSGAPLILYGPFLEEGVGTAPSNAAFDNSLRSRNPAWGIRDLADIDTLAKQGGFSRIEGTGRYAMPANNLMLVYRRA